MRAWWQEEGSWNKGNKGIKGALWTVANRDWGVAARHAASAGTAMSTRL